MARGTPIAASMMIDPGMPQGPPARAVPILHNASNAPDPVLLAIETARAARRHANAELPGDAAPFSSPEVKAAEAETWRRVKDEDRTYLDVFRLRPTTREGLFALVDFAREPADFQATMVHGAGGAAEDGDRYPAARDVLGAIRS